MSVSDAAASARAVTDAILADLAKAERGVVVDSPPGAGKSTLVVAAAASLAERGERVMVVGQTNEQVDDLIDRMAGEHGVLRIGRLSAQDYTPAPRVARHPNVTARTALADLIDHPLVIATAAPAVSAAFYPFSGFTAATARSDRAMRWTTRPFGMTSFDLALQTAADTGWALYELPHRHTLRTDAEAVDACAELAARVLLRGAGV